MIRQWPSRFLLSAVFFLGLLLHARGLSSQVLSVSTVAGSTSGGGWIDGNGSEARFSFPVGVTLDGSGSAYVADQSNHVIRRIAPTGAVTTVAGLAGVAGSQDGTVDGARFNFPRGIAAGPGGNLYVADTYNHTVRRISPTGVVTTLAGAPGVAGTSDGTGAAARFTYPTGLDVDDAGNVFVADTSNHTVRKITPNGIVTTVAGVARSEGSSDGFGSQARFYFPFDVAIGPSGFVYVADTDNHMIRRISAEGHVTTMAGVAANPYDDNPSPGSKDGIGAEARFNYPWSIDVDSAGNIFVADTWNHLVRRITPALAVTTIAGAAEVLGNQDAVGSAARFHAPSGIALADDGTLFIADRYNHAVRRMSLTSLAVSTLAGSVPRWGVTNARGVSARFFFPEGIAYDASGNLYVAEYSHAIRKISPDGMASTLAGLQGTSGSSDGTGTSARFRSPLSVTVDPNGNVIVADMGNHTIRKITAAGLVSTLAGAAGTYGDVTGAGTQARFEHPFAVAADGLGNVYVADTYNHRIKVIDPAGVVSNFVGSGSAGSRNGVGESASFRYPTGIAVDSSRNIYVADWGNHTIRKVTQSGQVSTLAGSAGTSGAVDGNGSIARFDSPRAVAARPDGTLFVVDTDNHTIRRISPGGDVSTVAGVADAPGNVDGSGNSARFFFPEGIAVDTMGRIAVSDTYNHAIKIATAAAPTILSFSASPQILQQPGPVTLHWTTSNGTSASIDNGVGAVSVTGSRTVTVTTTTKYTLTVLGDGGSASSSVTVVVGGGRRRAVAR